jgi:hypothetical protein
VTSPLAASSHQMTEMTTLPSTAPTTCYVMGGYVVTCSRTASNSMVQGLSWKVDTRTVLLWWNLMHHFYVYKYPHYWTLSRVCPVSSTASHLPKILFVVIIPSADKFLKHSVTSRFSD